MSQDIRSGLKRYSINERKSEVTVDDFAKSLKKGLNFSDFVHSLPKILASKDIQEVAKLISERTRNDSSKILMMGAHPIKVGVSPIIVQTIEKGIFNCVAGNGALAIHDVEIAMIGATSEDVESAIQDGSFGMAKETSIFINEAIKEGAKKNIGFGLAVGQKIISEKLKYENLSVLANCVKYKIPSLILVAIGTDIIHMHPECDGESLGKTSYADFISFSNVVTKLQNGYILNLGSAVIMPEVFLKALSISRNIGNKIENFISVNMDFEKHYRPTKNILERPGGKSYTIIGHHEINFPLLVAMIIENL